MRKTMLAILSLSLFICSPVLAHDTEPSSDFAEYSVIAGVSPFGGSLMFGYNKNEKTSWLVGFGGLPGGNALEFDIDGTKYDVDSSSAWAGFFINHRPLENAMWFRLVAGLGFGSIENELDDGNGNKYRADYRENPVGYVGVGFGSQAKKGFLIGFDIGMLYTGGPMVRPVAGDGADVEAIEDFWMFDSVLPNGQLTLGYGF